MLQLVSTLIVLRIFTITRFIFMYAHCSKQGLMSHEFFKAGVYYFSDQNFQEAAEYVGTIIVKPKQKEHFIELTENGFTPGNLLDSVQRQFGYCCLAPICSLANHKTIYNQRTNIIKSWHNVEFKISCKHSCFVNRSVEVINLIITTRTYV